MNLLNALVALANFVIIPEPSSSHLLLLFLGLVFGMRAVMKKETRRERISHRRG